MYLELNLSDEGAQPAQRALHTFQRLGMGYEAAKALTNLALSASRDRNPQEALRLFGKAHSLFSQEHNHSWKAIIDLYQALVFYRENKLEEAARLCDRALAFLRASPLRGKSLVCQLLTGPNPGGVRRSGGGEAHLPGGASDARTDRIARVALSGLVCIWIYRGGAWLDRNRL
jgi:tetratricopeptide (TPR) repeat protein